MRVISIQKEKSSPGKTTSAVTSSKGHQHRQLANVSTTCAEYISAKSRAAHPLSGKAPGEHRFGSLEMLVLNIPLFVALGRLGYLLTAVSRAADSSFLLVLSAAKPPPTRHI